MRTWGRASAFWTVLLSSSLWLLLASVVPAAAARTEPVVKVYDHPNVLVDLNYFPGSDSVLFRDFSARTVFWSPDGGVTWSRAPGVPEGVAALLLMHEFDNKRAYIITESKDHWVTTDRGESWRSFSSKVLPSAFQNTILRFHADDPGRVIFHGMECEGRYCSERTMYTADGFGTIETLRVDTDGCWWARSSRLFTTGDDALDKDRVLCIIRDPHTGLKQHQRLVTSDQFFAESANGDLQEFEPNLDTDRPVQGIISIAAVKKYFLAATTSLNTDEMALFVTDDTLRWHRAVFPTDHGHHVRQEAYTVLEGTEYSIQVDVLFSSAVNPLGALFTSNSNGTYFTENVHFTNRKQDGRVDFEKVSGIQGVFLVNSVENGADVERNWEVEKKIVSRITFDDGRTLEPMHAGGKRVHLHGFTELDNSGKVFSSPAPGLVMGNGNTGDKLGRYRDANLFVSDDAGVTWKQALEGPHKYEFGDQGSILVAVKDYVSAERGPVGEFAYSLNHGDDWTTVPLPGGLEIQPYVLTTTQQSAGLKFILTGRSRKGGSEDDESRSHVISIDFDGLHGDTCGDGDMEDWHARVNRDGEPSCVMGHRQTFRRRKKDANCFIKKPFTEPVPKSEPCECDDADFECDYNFVKDRDDDDEDDDGGGGDGGGKNNKYGKCKLAGLQPVPAGACAGPEGTFKGSSGWRQIPGNQCRGGKKKDEPVDRNCKDASGVPKGPGSDRPESSRKVLAPGFDDVQKIYLERGDTSSDDDEIVIARGLRWSPDGSAVADTKLWRTADHGKTWKRILEKESVVNIYPHQYFRDVVFFTTKDSDRVIYTIDHGEHFHEFKAPLPADDYPLFYHPDRPDWLIWVGRKYEKVADAHVLEAYLSTHRGDGWKPLLADPVEKCEFTGRASLNFRPSKQVVCLVRGGGPGSSKNLVGSKDFFDEDSQVLARDVKNFATMAEFIVVAAEDDDHQGLKALTSIDGVHFEEAKFPLNSIVPHENAYTVLDSSTHAVRLFVATQTAEGHRYGNIVKSNSNGTLYSRIAEAVNCNDDYYVDFEKITGLEGVLLINTVVNREQVHDPKVVQTRISHNDGAEWAYLAPPDADLDGKPYDCRGTGGRGDERCGLHLHHYTEREDKSKTFSASSAVGVMFGVGNVGPSLGKIQDADTFLTTDGGVTWRNVARGTRTWQFGDQGSLLVLVRRYTAHNKVKTRSVLYSTNEGDSWKEHVFSDKEVKVLDLTTLRSGSSRNFLIWARDGDDVVSFNLDFAGLYDGPCRNPKADDDDYYLWSPKHPLQDDDCFFGHVSKYYRKKKDRRCYNDQPLDHLYQVSNCQCSRRDYECDYNYEMDKFGQCKLVEQHEPLSTEQWCEQHPNASTWYEPTGYRKLSLSTCEGGNELEKTSRAHPCPGHESEFDEEHRVSGVAVFFAVVLPIVAAAGVGWYVWRNWDGRFGQIRLGESGGLEGESPWVRYTVIVISALVAAAAAVPLVATIIWRTATSAYERVRGTNGGRGGARFTTRDSFSRGRGDYAVVDEDEGELLGDDSDEE